MANGGTPFTKTTPQPPPVDPRQEAALRGIQAGSGAPPQAAGPAPPQGGVSQLFVALTQAIMQEGLTDEVLASFEDFIQFFQQVASQAQGATQPGAPPTQPPVQGPPPGGPLPGGPPPGGGVPPGAF